jgi:hypothetical protein
MIVHTEVERMMNEVVMTVLNYYPQDLPEGTDESCKEPVRVADLWAENLN